MKQTKWSAVGCKEQQRPLEAEQGPDIGSREGHGVKLGKQRCDWGKRELGQDGDFFIFFSCNKDATHDRFFSLALFLWLCHYSDCLCSSSPH